MTAQPPDFYPAPYPVPARHSSREMTFVPLTPAHVALDYAALMSSKSYLRLWSGSAWPPDDFTLADNLEDMEWHWQEHQERIAFTYTILNPAESECLGCVYLKPLASRIPTTTQGKGELPLIGERETAVRFWIKAPLLATGLEQRCLHTLHNWFNQAWAFKKVYFHASVHDTRQLDLYQANGLTYQFTLDLADRGGDFQYWRTVDQN